MKRLVDKVKRSLAREIHKQKDQLNALVAAYTKLLRGEYRFTVEIHFPLRTSPAIRAVRRKSLREAVHTAIEYLLERRSLTTKTRNFAAARNQLRCFTRVFIWTDSGMPIDISRERLWWPYLESGLRRFVKKGT